MEEMTPADQRKLDMIQHIVHDWGKLVEIFTTPEHRPPPLNHAVERAFLVECRNFANFFPKLRVGGAQRQQPPRITRNQPVAGSGGWVMMPPG